MVLTPVTENSKRKVKSVGRVENRFGGVTTETGTRARGKKKQSVEEGGNREREGVVKNLLCKHWTARGGKKSGKKKRKGKSRKQTPTVELGHRG